MSAFLLSCLPSAAEYTPQHREQWRKYAEDSYSSSDRSMWGSLGRPLQAKKSLVGICCFANLKHHLKNRDSNETYSRTIFWGIIWTCASPLQFAKYTWTPTFWHSVHICRKIKRNRSYINIITLSETHYSDVWMSRLSRCTCMNSLAPATSTNITLLQSINTALTSVSAVSEENKNNYMKEKLFFLISCTTDQMNVADKQI